MRVERRGALGPWLFVAGAVLVTALLTGCFKSDPPVPTAAAEVPDDFDRISCSEIMGTAFRSPTERQWFEANCSKWPAVDVIQIAPAAPLPPECDAMRGKPYESAEQRRWYLDNCTGRTPANAASPQRSPATASGQPPPGGPARGCDAIRGRPYQSDAERDWYLANCNQPAPAPAPGGADRTDCNAIRGTAYNSANERQWYLANCTGRDRGGDDDDD
jgi:hypothetical protein